MELYDFIEKCKPHHLTIADVKKLKPGDKLDIVAWDRKFEKPWIWRLAKDGKPYTPQYFFRENRHLCDMNQFELYVPHLSTWTDWIEIHDDGYIYETVVCERDAVPPYSLKYLHWTEFPETTRVGKWGGPIMLWENLKEMPNVYYNSF